MARIIWSSSCAALRSSFDCSTILHPETGAQRPSGESLYRVHSAAMILCIARLKHQACHTLYVLRTIGSRLATRAFPRCLDSKGVCSVSPVRSTSCTPYLCPTPYRKAELKLSLRLIDINSRQTFFFTFQLVCTTLFLSSCLSGSGNN